MKLRLITTKTTQFQIIFSDIDGTLLDSSNRISAGTRQKIQELSRIGVPFILVSARMPSGILPLQRELGITAPIICYSGALILNEHGESLQSIGIEREKAILIDTFIKSEWSQISCGAFCHQTWIVDDAQNRWVVQEQAITSSVPTEGALSDCIPPNGQIHKFLCMGDAGHIAALTTALKEKYPELAIHRSKATYLEIMEGAASKSSALAVLCKQSAIPVEAAVSFGDGFNDVDMLLATGMSFAMGNAPEEVKRQAKFVTPDNDHEGVLAGLNQLDFAGNRLKFTNCLRKC